MLLMSAAGLKGVSRILPVRLAFAPKAACTTRARAKKSKGASKRIAVDHLFLHATNTASRNQRGQASQQT